MKATKKFYKVVNTESAKGVLTSSRAKYKSQLIYKLNEWTLPTIKYSKIFVFDSLDRASQYHTPACEDIYECEVKNPTRQEYMSDWSGSADLFSQWWKAFHEMRGKIGKLEDSYFSLNGVAYCDSIKLIKKVS